MNSDTEKSWGPDDEVNSCRARCTTSSLAIAFRAILERVQPLWWSLTLRADLFALSVQKLKTSTKSSQSLTKPLIMFISISPRSGWSNTQSNSLEKKRPRLMWGVSCLHCLWHHQYHQSTDCRYCTAQIVQSNGVLRYMVTRHTWWQAIHGYHHSVECQPVVQYPSESQLRHRMNMGWWISVRPWDFQLDLWRDDYQDGHMVTERHFLDFHMTQNNVHHHACEYEH